MLSINDKWWKLAKISEQMRNIIPHLLWNLHQPVMIFWKQWLFIEIIFGQNATSDNGDYPSLRLTSDITLLEYFPILVDNSTLGDSLRNKKVLFSPTTRQWFTFWTAKPPRRNKSWYWLGLWHWNVWNLIWLSKAEHIPGAKNKLSDCLSRLQITRFKELAPDAAEHPETIPTHLWQIFSVE